MLLYIQCRKDIMVILPWFLQLVCILQWSIKAKRNKCYIKNNYICPFKARHALLFLWEQHSLLGFFWLLILILHFDSFILTLLHITPAICWLKVLGKCQGGKSTTVFCFVMVVRESLVCSEQLNWALFFRKILHVRRNLQLKLLNRMKISKFFFCWNIYFFPFSTALQKQQKILACLSTSYLNLQIQKVFPSGASVNVWTFFNSCVAGKDMEDFSEEQCSV